VVLKLVHIWALVGFVVWPMMARSLPGQVHPQIVVWVYNDAGVEGATILGAEKIAAQIYQRAGFEIAWNNCPSLPGAGHTGCLQALPPGRIFLHIEHQPRTPAEGIYGVAFLGDGGWGAYCDLFYDRIVALHRQGAASEARMLGIIAAHEIGHLLLGSNAHSPEGIMRPQWQSEDFWRPGPGGTAFSCQQQQKILSRLALLRNKEGTGAGSR